MLATNELASHNHSGSSTGVGSHSHGSFGENLSNWPLGVYGGSGYGGSNDTDYDNPLLRTSTDGGHSHSITVGYNGGNARHNNVQPYKAVSRWYRSA